MITLFDLAVIAAILGFAWWGGMVGLRAAGIAALEVICCLIVAIVLHETVAGYLQAGLVMAFGDSVAQSWTILVTFAGLAWGTLAGIRTWLHAAGEDDDDAGEIDPLVDRIGGCAAGGVGGAALLGGALITLSMVPILSGLKPSGDRMLVDVGMLVLRMADSFVGERHEGRSLVVWGEPAARSSDLAARLASEPWFDTDQDGSFGEADRYRDVDGNGTFTQDLYYSDLDHDGMRRIGLADKYQVGCWSGDLLSLDRKRPEAAKPAAGAGKPAAGPGKPAAGAGKPAPTKPGDPQPTKPVTKPARPDSAKPPQPAPGPQPGDDF